MAEHPEAFLLTPVLHLLTQVLISAPHSPPPFHEEAQDELLRHLEAQDEWKLCRGNPRCHTREHHGVEGAPSKPA